MSETTAYGRGTQGTCLVGGDLLEAAIPWTSVPEQLSSLTVLLARLNRGDFLLEMTIGLDQILPTIEIDIEKEQAEGERFSARRADALVDRFVEEGASLCLCPVESRHLRREVCHRDSDTAVVSVVGCIESHRSGC